MARNDLASLATLAGIAYMMNRDGKKGEKGDKKAAVSGVDAVKEAAKIDTKPTGIDTGMSEKEPGWDSGSAPTASTASAAPRASGSSAGGGRGRMGGPTAAQAASNPGLSSAASAPAPTKAAYETPYDRMNRRNADAAQAKADTDVETRKLASAHPAPGRGVIDTSRINPNTLLPYKKGGKVKKMASGGSTSKGASVKGWGIARGARTAKTY
jgi:hypothetical protein